MMKVDYAWIKEHFDGVNNAGLCREYNSAHHTNIDPRLFNWHCKKVGCFSRGRKYTEAEKAWIKENYPMLGQMASESKLRTQNWLHYGCNAFDAKKPASNPMSFWTDQDVLLYLYERKIPIASVYGEIVKDTEIDGQLDLEDLGIFDLGRPTLRTTGARRTGCMFCGFGCHLEKSPTRFELMKKTHPKQYEYIMKPWEEGGLGYKEVIDWINENGDLHIKY